MHAREITIAYGLTEASPVITQTTTDDPLERACETVGQALPGVEVRVVDPDTGADCAPDEPGELLLPRLQHHEGLLQHARGHRRRPSTPTAGCTPATSALSMRTATTASPAGSRT